LRAVVDLQAMVNIEHVDNADVLVDAVDDAIGAAPGAVTTRERPKQRIAYPVRVHRERGIAELQHGGGNGFREPLGNSLMRDAGVDQEVRMREVGHAGRDINDRYTHVLEEAHRAAAEQTAALVREAGGTS